MININVMLENSLQLFISLTLFSYIGTFIIIKIAKRHNIVDIPNYRSSHVEITPRGGGLAIVLSFYIGITLLYFKNLIDPTLFWGLLSGIPIVIVGVIDDLRDVAPKFRLAVQFFSIILALFFIGPLNLLDFGFIVIKSKYILYPLCLFGGVWFINLYNFLDGIDGYAATEAIFVALATFFFVGEVSLIIFAVSVLGFLVWNFPKARVFMGDVGSTLLGFILIVFGIYYNNSGQLNFLFWLVFTSLFWFDASLTVFRRLKNKEKLSQAHKKHAYQRIVQAGYSHTRTILYALLFNFLLFGLVLWTKNQNNSIIIPVSISLLLNYLVIYFVDRKKPFNR